MASSSPGIVYLRKYATDNETTIIVLKNKDQRFPQLCPELPEIIPMKGLDPQRQLYLYEEVAPYCYNAEVCPRPACPKPIIYVESQIHADSDDKKMFPLQKPWSLQTQKWENSVPWLNSEVNVAEMFLVFMMLVAMEMGIFHKQIFNCYLIKNNIGIFLVFLLIVFHLISIIPKFSVWNQRACLKV